jgi:hypothetical protein
VIFMVNTRNMFDLPDTGYADLTLWSRLAGSVQAIWMLAAVMLLPTRTAADARRLEQRISGSPVRARVGS